MKDECFIHVKMRGCWEPEELNPLSSLVSDKTLDQQIFIKIIGPAHKVTEMTEYLTQQNSSDTGTN